MSKRARLTRGNSAPIRGQELSARLEAIRIASSTLNPLLGALFGAIDFLHGLEADELAGLELKRSALHEAVRAVPSPLEDAKHRAVDAHCSEAVTALETAKLRKVAAIELEQVVLERFLIELDDIAPDVAAAVAN